MLHATRSSQFAVLPSARVDGKADAGTGWTTGAMADPCSLDLDNAVPITVRLARAMSPTLSVTIHDHDPATRAFDT